MQGARTAFSSYERTRYAIILSSQSVTCLLSWHGRCELPCPCLAHWTCLSSVVPRASLVQKLLDSCYQNNAHGT